MSTGIITLNDPVLIGLERDVQRWWNRFLHNDRPCWLLLCGNSGTGKTHCARAIWRKAVKLGLTCDYRHEFDSRMIWFPEFINDLRGGKAWDEQKDMRRWPLVVLDEIGASRDTTGFVADQLYYTLAVRETRWKVITSNLRLEEFMRLDERIASRLFRNDGIAVEVLTQDYALRRKG